MTLTRKRQFVRSLCNSVRDAILSASVRMPAEWDGFELRQLIADEFQREAMDVTRGRGRRARAFREGVAVLGRLGVVLCVLLVSACEQVGVKRDDGGDAGSGDSGGAGGGGLGGSGGGGMSADTGDTGGSGGGAGMGGMGGSAGDAGTDATDTGADTRPLGSACTAATDCGSGFCVGMPGRCCDSACPGPCNACGTGYCEVANEGKSCAAATCDGDPTLSPYGEATAGSGCVAATSLCKTGACVTATVDCCKNRFCCELGEPRGYPSDLAKGTCRAGCINVGSYAMCAVYFPVEYTACPGTTICHVNDTKSYAGTCK